MLNAEKFAGDRSPRPPGAAAHGGGGQTSPGFQGNPYPKLRTPRIRPTIFLGGETEVHVQKQIKIKMNDIDSPKLGAGPPQLPSCGGSCPPAPPPPAPASLGIGGRNDGKTGLHSAHSLAAAGGGHRGHGPTFGS